MNRIVITYSHSREDDTKIVYSYNEVGSHLDMSYTDEDPAYGTDKLEYNSTPVASLEQMAKDYMEKLKEYLDKTGDGLRRPGKASRELEIIFGEYSNSTLYAIENALGTIVGRRTEIISNDGNLMQIMTVEKAAQVIKDGLSGSHNVYFDLGVGADEAHIDQYARYGGDLSWFGVKRIHNNKDLFGGDGYCRDFIFIVGHYGGGNIEVAMYVDDEYTGIDEQSPERLMDAICRSTGLSRKDKILVETIKKEEKDA